MKLSIDVEHVSIHYGKNQVVSDITFSVMQGQISAFLGPNGAGKSTTMKLLATILRPACGKIMVEGYAMSTQREQIKRNIGVVFQEDVLDNELSVYQNLYYRGSLYIQKRRQVLERIEEVAALLSLENILPKRYGNCSGGQKRICQIGRALMSCPKLLLLDEPTTGLDPIAREIVWKVIYRLNREYGMTIFYATHYMEETMYADHLCVMKQGRILACGKKDDILKQYGRMGCRNVKDVYMKLLREDSGI